MIKRCLFSVITVWMISFPALAHSPYYSQSESIAGSSDQITAIKLLHGDGIFFADPIRAVVVDQDGRLLAVSPMSPTLFLSCKGEGVAKKCVVYDEIYGRIYAPDKASWKASELLEEGGEPNNYPEYLEKEYGFYQRKASLLEIAKYEALSIASLPLKTVAAVIWWTIMWFLITPLFWRLKQNRWRIKNSSIIAGFLIFLRVALVTVLVFIAAYGWLLDPYSLYFLAFVVTLGAALALVITKPRASN